MNDLKKMPFSKRESCLIRSSRGLKMPFWACSRPFSPSATTPNHDPSGRVLAAARTNSFSPTFGLASTNWTVIFESGVKFFLAWLLKNWL